MEHVIDVIGEGANMVVRYGPMGSDAQLSRKAGYDEVVANYPGIQNFGLCLIIGQYRLK